MCAGNDACPQSIPKIPLAYTIDYRPMLSYHRLVLRHSAFDPKGQIVGFIELNLNEISYLRQSCWNNRMN
jgi:hypothetical protein